jgi:hypothetical protein
MFHAFYFLGLTFFYVLPRYNSNNSNNNSSTIEKSLTLFTKLKNLYRWRFSVDSLFSLALNNCKKQPKQRTTKKKRDCQAMVVGA